MEKKKAKKSDKKYGGNLKIFHKLLKMNEIKFKKNIKKVLTLKKKSTILFVENQGRQPPFEMD